MPQTDMQEESQGAAQNSPPSLSDGYLIQIAVHTNGFTIEGPLPLPAEPSDADREQAEDVSTLTDALKHVLAIVKENPLTNDANEQMKAGFTA